MMKKIFWILMIVFAILVGLYPGIYFLIDRTFGLLRSKPDALLSDIFWNMAFYTHIILGGLSLLIGWTQFNTSLRTKRISWHRGIGKIYIIAVVLSSVAGLYIGIFATGGFPAALGFILLGLIWLITTVKAYATVRKGFLITHQKLMIYSYAACFSAVTLRIWLPLLVIIFGDFNIAYMIVAWLCWVPNMIFAYMIVRKIGAYKNRLAQA